MSSTLSEGVRVPDIGSVNWGADVNYNWGLLNTALANISGNVKTDVANTWTAPQTFTETISGSIDGIAARAVGDEDGTNIKSALATKAADNAVVHLAGAETITGDKTFTGATATHNITPETDNTYSLGSSSLRWQRINTGSVWSWGSYIFNTGITAAAQGTQSVPLNYNILNAITSDSSPLPFCFQSLSLSNTLTQHSLNLRLYDSNGVLVATEQLLYRLTSSGLRVYPATSEQDSLGTSSNKWKTLNGINPGALSLPSITAEVDIASSIADVTGGDNWYVPPVDGYLSVVVQGTVTIMLFNTTHRQFYYGTSCMQTDAEGNSWVCLPVKTPYHVRIRAIGTVAKAVFYPCLGNV